MMFEFRFLKLPLLVAGLGLLLSGCANTLTSDVVTFHEGPQPNGERIRVVPIDHEKAPSLEFRSYTDLVYEELRKVGYTPVTDENAAAELVAEVDYSVEAGQPLDMDGRSPYVRYHFSAGRFYDPFYYAGGFYDPYYFSARRFYDPFSFGIYDTWGPGVSTAPTFLHNLQLNIVRNDETNERIFEGRVQSSGYDNQLPEVMPYLVSAMFQNFPGESGVTKVVTIEKDQ